MPRLEDIYHETATIEIDMQKLKSLGLEAGKDYKVKNVEVPDFDYSVYPIWVEQKKASIKEYKKLKEIEFNIRNK